MSQLWDLFLRNKGKIVHKYHHYFPIYEKHFSKFRNQDINFLEIGCGQGGSLSIWKEYLGPYATIVGIDINPQCKSFESDQIHVRIGDQSDQVFLKSVIDEFGSFDIILDDGSHIMSHIKASFDFLYPYVLKNGVYMVEDLHTAYWEEYEGGLKNSNSFIEITKELIDSLNWCHSKGEVKESYFALNTTGIHFYDSIIAFDKASNGKKIISRTGYEDGSEIEFITKRLNKLKERIRNHSNPFKYIKSKLQKEK